MRADQIVISRPCPVDFDALGVDRSGLDFHCPRCDKTVHALSNRTQDEAQALLAALRGQQACVSYAHAEDGEVQFRAPAPVIPVERLRARRRVASGLALALAACTPQAPAQPDNDDAHEAQPSPASAPAPVVAAPPTAVQAPEAPSNPEPPVSPAEPATTVPAPIPTTIAAVEPPPRSAPARKQKPAPRKTKRRGFSINTLGML